MNEFIVGEQYSVDPRTIKFDEDVVKLNRLCTEEEYASTLLSIKEYGQFTPIYINNTTGLCEDGRHRVKACKQLDINVQCVEINGSLSIDARFEHYNTELVSGRDYSVAQKAVMALRWMLLTKEPQSKASEKFKVNKREIIAASVLNGINKDSVLEELFTTGKATNPLTGKTSKSIRTIATAYANEAEDADVVTVEADEISYEEMISTLKGRAEYLNMMTTVDYNDFRNVKLMAVEFMNTKYRLKEEAGEKYEEFKDVLKEVNESLDEEIKILTADESDSNKESNNE